MKAYWISLYTKVNDQENLKKYAETVTPIIKSYGGFSLVRGGKNKTFDGGGFFITGVLGISNYEQDLKCHQSKK